jgi:hypothetical protein
MKKMIVVAALIVGAAIGSGVTWLFSDKPPRLAFKSRAEIVLTDVEGHEVGSIPSGVTLFSAQSLDRVDVGWWGYLPVYLGTTDEAETMVTAATRPLDRSVRHMINGQARATVLHPRREKPASDAAAPTPANPGGV